MLRSSRQRRLLAVVSAGFAATSQAQYATFTGLTDPFPDVHVDGIRAVNADGSVVVGYTYKATFPEFGNRSFRWQRGVGFDNPGPTQGSVLSYAYGVSANGNVISGNTGHAQFGDQEAWVRVGASRGHVGSPPGSNFSSLFGISADGRIVAGYGGNQDDPNSAQAAYYDTQDDHWSNLGFFPGQSWSRATAASADGSVIVGTAVVAPYVTHAFRWTATAGLVDLAGRPDWTQSRATAVSADGETIVGYDEAGGTVAWRWTAAGGMQQIGDGSPMWAMGVSPDGQVVVGVDQRSGSSEPFIWDLLHGVRNLRAVLEGLGLSGDMAGWSLCCAMAINQSGGTYAIAGEGGDPAGYIAGWVATVDSLDTPCPSIVTQPDYPFVAAGSPAVFTVVAAGPAPLSYQWRQNGTPLADGPRISGATTSALSIDPTWLSDDGALIDVVVTNDCGSATSQATMLTVYAQPADTNCDGTVDFFDIDPFLLALFDSAGYSQMYPGCGLAAADVNYDGSVDFFDIDPFLLCLFGRTCP